MKEPTEALTQKVLEQLSFSDLQSLEYYIKKEYEKITTCSEFQFESDRERIKKDTEKTLSIIDAAASEKINNLLYNF